MAAVTAAALRLRLRLHASAAARLPFSSTRGGGAAKGTGLAPKRTYCAGNGNPTAANRGAGGGTKKAEGIGGNGNLGTTTGRSTGGAAAGNGQGAGAAANNSPAAAGINTTAAPNCRGATKNADGLGSNVNGGGAPPAGGGANKAEGLANGNANRSAVAGIQNGPVAAPPNCRGALEELRSDLLTEHRRLWDNHNRLVGEERITRSRVAELRAAIAAQEIVTANAESESGFRAVVLGGALLFGSWFGLSSYVKDSWEECAIGAFEEKNRNAAALTAAAAYTSP